MEDEFKKDPKKLLENIKEIAGRINRALTARENVNLMEFEGKVKALCQSIPSMPIAEARALKPDIEHMITMLAEWQSSLEQRKDSIKKTIDDVNRQKRAQNAYLAAKLVKPNDNNQ
jgi:hypothetical protein